MGPSGFMAEPVGETGSAVLVLHAWWGLNDEVKAFCRRLADRGFHAFAPDLYHGKTADSVGDAETLAHSLDANHLQAKAEIVEAARFIAGRGAKGEQGIAVIGFSLGAYYALDLAASQPDLIRAVVLFYGTGPADHRNSRAAYLGHFAANDDFEPREGVDALEHALRDAGRPVTFHHYPETGHWFFEADRADAYRPEAAELAWQRTVDFFS